MNRLYIFYPHVYTKATPNELLIYDTLSFKREYVRGVVISSNTITGINKFGYIDDSEENKCIIDKICNNSFGYFIFPQNVMPYMPERKLRITTSLRKEAKALGHNLSSYTNMMLKSVSLLLNNTVSTYLTSFAYLQLEYPNFNWTKIDVHAILLQLKSFCLEHIVLSGELSPKDLDDTSLFAQRNDIRIIWRIHYLACSTQYIQGIFAKYKSIMIELLVDSNTPPDMLNLAGDRLILKYMVIKRSDLDAIVKMENRIALCPIFLKFGQVTIQPEMIMTKEEILQSNQSLNECYIKGYINSNCFGHLTINHDGVVFCLNQQLESIHKKDLACIVNDWVTSENCLWYFARYKKDICKDCALQVLCPSITIYEELNIYKCPCKV